MMKQRFLLGLCVLASVFMTGCSTDDATTNSPVTNFSEMQDVSLSFYDVSMRPIGEGMMQTRADDKSPAFTRLDVKLLSENGSYLYRQYYSDKTPEDFGKLQIKVPVGDYQMVAIASKYTDEDSVGIASASSITFPSDKLTDMQQAVVPVTVKAGTTNNVSATLKRTISKFLISCTDVIPVAAKNVRFKVSGNCGITLNPSTGNAESEAVYQRTILAYVPGKDRTGALYAIYFLLNSAEERDINIEVSVLDAANKVLVSKTFNHVGMKQGFITTYTGALFSDDTTLNFTFDTSEMTTSGYDSTF